MQTVVWRAMGAQMRAVLDTASPRAAQRLATVPAWFETWEARLSRFRRESELNRLNAGAGDWQVLSPVAWEVAQAAFEAARATDGLVSPLVLEAVVAAGYDRSFEALPVAAAAPPRLPEPCQDWRAVERRPSRRALRLPMGAGLDFGGIGKGWAADRAADRLGQFGPALVDAGGDIAVSAPPRRQPGWSIGVADPLRPDDLVLTLCLPRGGVATSGRDYRRWRSGGREQHHLIDPRTGRPALTDSLAATVIAPTAARAEAAAKAALLLGSAAGLAWLDARADLAGLLIRDDGRVLFSQRLERFLWRST
ncbi:MAG: FAD:protein FMN transferase [Anaerolineales bacterium]|nr:FAD:protein FMN transferase [Anaerolineales bacterium]